MKVAGFSFVRNALLYDYPIKEAILSVLPLCDDFFIAVGKSEDDTLNYIKSFAEEKIRIIETVWDETLREGGKVLAVETNKALDAIGKDYDWAFYIQADEIVHEKYYPEILKNLKLWKDDKRVDGLLFNYLHFYGSYDYVADSPKWYRNEIRIIRPNGEIYSYKDAQGFRKNNNKHLNVKKINACIYHYGWVKRPDIMQQKQQNFHKFWHNDNWVEKNVVKSENFDYSNISSLKKFNDTHPKIMEDRISSKNWKFDYDISYKKYSLKEYFKLYFEKLTGYRIGEYKNYKII